MDFEEFVTNLEETGIFDEMLIDFELKELFGYFIINEKEKALFQLYIYESELDDQISGEVPIKKGDPIMVIIFPDMISNKMWGFDGGGYEKLFPFFMQWKKELSKYYGDSWIPCDTETGMHYYCIDTSFIPAFNLFLVEFDKIVSIFNDLPHFRQVKFYFAMKDDKKWRERLGTFLDKYIDDTTSPSIDSFEPSNLDGAKNFTAKSRKMHILDELEWGTPYVIQDGNNIVNYFIIKIDKLNTFCIVSFLFFLLFNAGKVSDHPDEKELCAITDQIGNNVNKRINEENDKNE